MEQMVIFGLPEHIGRPKQKHSLCGCYIPDTPEHKQAAIEKHLKSGKTITVLEALKRYHTTELRKVICRLKNKGLAIVDTWHEVDGKRKYKVYRLGSV